MIRPLTTIEDPARPFRLWDPDKKAVYRYRYYSDSRRAHLGALIEARWAKPGIVVEVYDSRDGKLLGQYVREDHTITFMGERKPNG